MVQNHLDYWSDRIYESKELELMHVRPCAGLVPSVLLHDKIKSFPPIKQTEFDNLSQFLQCVPATHLDEYTTGPQFKAVKSLQTEEFLKSSEPPITRYEHKKGDKNKKTKTDTNPTSGPNFILQWIKRERGTLGVPHKLPIPKEGAHTINMVLPLLDMMKNDMEDLRNWGLWTMAKFPDENCSLRTKIDGDYLQAFVAIQKCGILEVYNQ